MKKEVCRQRDEWSDDMKKRQLYSGAFKVKVVLNLLQGEKSLMQLAEEHDLHPNQIKNWKSIFIRKAIEFMEDKRIKKKPCDELKCN
ncbi:MAG: transposase [Pseudomonadota bacterium]